MDWSATSPRVQGPSQVQKLQDIDMRQSLDSTYKGMYCGAVAFQTLRLKLLAIASYSCLFISRSLELFNVSLALLYHSYFLGKEWKSAFSNPQVENARPGESRRSSAASEATTAAAPGAGEPAGPSGRLLTPRTL